jgi:hypothetical protein
MKKTFSAVFFLIIISMALTATSCMAIKKGNCGCPSKKGLVGY